METIAKLPLTLAGPGIFLRSLIQGVLQRQGNFLKNQVCSLVAVQLEMMVRGQKSLYGWSLTCKPGAHPACSALTVSLKWTG